VTAAGLRFAITLPRTRALRARSAPLQPAVFVVFVLFVFMF
jgi:hypothetical protein